MHNQLSCEQVTALLSFYAEDKLSAKLSESVKLHLENCPECLEKYQQLQKIFRKYIEIQNEEAESPYFSKQYEDFKSNLSAYIDNELDDFDSIKIKKIAISNPQARQDLEKIFNFKKLLHSSFEKTKNEFKHDYSKNITSKLQHNEYNRIDPFLKLAAVYFVMLTCIAAGIIRILYF